MLRTYGVHLSLPAATTEYSVVSRAGLHMVALHVRRQGANTSRAPLRSARSRNIIALGFQRSATPCGGSLTDRLFGLDESARLWPAMLAERRYLSSPDKIPQVNRARRNTHRKVSDRPGLFCITLEEVQIEILKSLGVFANVHGHEGAQLYKARINASARSGMRPRNGRDQFFFEPRQRVGEANLLTAVGLNVCPRDPPSASYCAVGRDFGLRP